jgi:hypothetical protein
MATSWFPNVRGTHRLTVFATSAVTGGPWAGVFTKAIDEFNKLSTAMNLQVTLVTGSSIRPPDPTSMSSGANVQFDVGDSKVHEITLQNKFGDIISQFTEDFSGATMHGLTIPPQWQDDKGVAHQFRAYVYVPKSPKVNTPAGQREVGDGIKLFIAVHELIHACGLSNADHSPESNADLFIGQPQPSPGNTPATDKLRIHLDPLVKLPRDPPDPPFFLTDRTAGLIRSIWN